MISRTTEKFRASFVLLPNTIKVQAKEAYHQFIPKGHKFRLSGQAAQLSFKNDPYHPSLQFKRVHSSKPIYSARINLDYRAVGIIQDHEIIWFWIGSHNIYEKLLKKL